MPEGDTIHKIAAAMRTLMAGQTLTKVIVTWHATPPAHGGRLEGRTIASVSAHGKHLFVHMDNQCALRVHLGMHGSWHRYGPQDRWRKPERHANVVLNVPGNVFVCFNARDVEVLSATGVRRSKLFSRLGPDLIGQDVNPLEIVARARAFNAPDTPVCDVLLDQRAAGGIGNVYKSEILFVRRLYPRERLDSVADTALASAYSLARELLTANLNGGPRMTRTPAKGDAGSLWVYGRKGRPCHVCANRIDYARFGRDWRSTYWCGQCQPVPSRGAPR